MPIPWRNRQSIRVPPRVPRSPRNQPFPRTSCPFHSTLCSGPHRLAAPSSAHRERRRAAAWLPRRC